MKEQHEKAEMTSTSNNVATQKLDADEEQEKLLFLTSAVGNTDLVVSKKAVAKRC